MPDLTKSPVEQDWLNRAQKTLPAGGFGNFDPSIVISHGNGSRVWDESGNEYVDFLIGSGPMLVGHANPEVNEVVREQIEKGSTFFASNAKGIELAEVICEAVACAEQLRYVSTGGEADMYAMRLAKAHTGKEKILKFEGGYHGMSAESLMSLAPQRLENFPNAVPDSAGISTHVKDSVIVAPFNDAEAATQLIEEYADEIAGVIVEPLQRLIPPEPGFLQTLRETTAKHGIVLIFDEVVTGFRLAFGGAQEKYGVLPDLCTLGKTIGGGFPLAAIAGRKDIMDHFDKGLVGEEGFTFQIGTLSGNPVASAAGLKTLEILRRPGVYEQMEASGKRVMASLEKHLSAEGLDAQIVGDPVLFDAIFTKNKVKDYRGVFAGNKAHNSVFNQHMRHNGILKTDSKFYIALAHNNDDLALTDAAIEASAKAVAESLG